MSAEIALQDDIKSEPAVGARQTDVDDYVLMQGIAAKDATALAQLYDRYNRLVFALCLRILQNRVDAEDVLAEIFWEVWSRSARYNATRGSPLTYLLTLSRSRSIDRRRYGKRSRTIPFAADSGTALLAKSEGAATDVTPLQYCILNETREKVSTALSRLDPNQRQAVELSFFDDLSHSQIAERLNKPLGTVKTYIRQGLIRLRESLRMD